MKISKPYRFISLLVFLLAGISGKLTAQVYTDSAYKDSTAYALLAMKEQAKKWGPNDTVVVPAIYYHSEIVNYKEMEMFWVSKLPLENLPNTLKNGQGSVMLFMLHTHMQKLPVPLLMTLMSNLRM